MRYDAARNIVFFGWDNACAAVPDPLSRRAPRENVRAPPRPGCGCFVARTQPFLPD